MMHARFCVGDKVFAKVRGYPAWPAKIEGFANKTPFRIRYDICFYGTGETSVVRDEDVCSFLENTHSLGKPKRAKNFDKAMTDTMADLTPAERKYLAKVEEEYRCRVGSDGDKSVVAPRSDSNDSNEPIPPNDKRRKVEQSSSLGEEEGKTSDQQAPAEFRTPLSGKMHPPRAYRPPLSARSQQIRGQHQHYGKVHPPRAFRLPNFAQRPLLSGQRPLYPVQRQPIPGNSRPAYDYLPFQIFLPSPPGQRPLHPVEPQPIHDQQPPPNPDEGNSRPGQSISHPSHGQPPFLIDLPLPPDQHPDVSVQSSSRAGQGSSRAGQGSSRAGQGNSRAGQGSSRAGQGSSHPGQGHPPLLADPSPPPGENEPPPIPHNDKATPQGQQQHPQNLPTSVKRRPVMINGGLTSKSKKVDGQYLVAVVKGNKVKIPLHLNKPCFLDSNDQRNWENHVRHHGQFLKKRLEGDSTFSIPIEDHMDRWTKDQAEKWNKKTEERLIADCNRRFDLLQVEQNLIQLYMGLRKALVTNSLDTSKCIESLDKIKDLELTPIMLKKNHKIVVDINNVREFTGPKSKKKRDKFNKDAETIRVKADYVYEIFQKLFECPEEMEFLDYFMEEVEKFKNKISDMTLEERIRLTSEPEPLHKVTERPSSPPRKKLKKSKKKSRSGSSRESLARRLRSTS